MLHPAREPRPPSPTSPSAGGYLVAILVSLFVFAVELGAVEAFALGNADDFLDVVIVVVLFGAVPAAVIGSIGVLVVHFLTRRASSQWPAVILAWGVGLVVGLIVWQGDVAIAVQLGAAAAAGRLAVVPHARRRTA